MNNFKCSVMHMTRKMATGGLRNSTENKLLDTGNLNVESMIIERAYTLAGDDKDAFKFLMTLFKSKTSIAIYHLLNRV